MSNELYEIWKLALNGRVLVSSLGTIIRIGIPESNKIPLRATRTVLPHKNSGYLRVKIWHNGRSRPFQVHALVTEAFLGLRPKGLVVNHKDLNKLNNKIENLEYVTDRENHDHATRMGVQRGHKGESHHKAKLKVSDVLEIRRLNNSGLTAKQVGLRFGVGESNIFHIWKNIIWKVPTENINEPTK